MYIIYVVPSGQRAVRTISKLRYEWSRNSSLVTHKGQRTCKAVTNPYLTAID